MTLSRLIYISEPCFDRACGSTMAQLNSIMASSKRRNQAASVTGALIYDEASFLQILEGDRRVIWQTFSRIADDERHAGCLLVEMVEVAERLFGNWWMGLATRNETTAAVFEPYLVNGSLQADMMSGADILRLARALARLGLKRDLQSGDPAKPEALSACPA